MKSEGAMNRALYFVTFVLYVVNRLNPEIVPANGR